jgi:hypothetical protein
MKFAGRHSNAVRKTNSKFFASPIELNHSDATDTTNSIQKPSRLRPHLPRRAVGQKIGRFALAAAELVYKRIWRFAKMPAFLGIFCIFLFRAQEV